MNSLVKDTVEVAILKTEYDAYKAFPMYVGQKWLANGKLYKVIEDSPVGNVMVKVEEILPQGVAYRYMHKSVIVSSTVKYDYDNDRFIY